MVNPLKTLENEPDKVVKTKERKKKGASAAPFSLSPQESAKMPDRSSISPEVMRKFGLRYGTEEWPPQRREKD
jgi:hypothetical protein